MSGRRRAPNPVLIGAATILVVVIGVFLAYNANRGLPFVPTYRLTAELPNAAQLVRGNEVRIGGTRVGIIDAIGTKRYDDGRVSAVVDLKLEASVDPLPKDSTLIVRSRSALGLKYISIVRGTSDDGFAEGDAIPLASATPRPVELDELANTFDKPTREASRTNLREFGDAVMGRGTGLNRAFGDLGPVLRDLEPVARTLSDPDTGLGALFQALRQTAAEVAPVATEQAQLFGNLDKTFAAFADVGPELQEAVRLAPDTLDTAIELLPRQRGFLEDSTRLFTALQPATDALRRASGDLASGVEKGTPTLLRAPAINAEITKTLTSLETFAQDPSTDLGLRGLTTLVQVLAPTLTDVTPAQTTCNYVGVLARNLSTLFSTGDARGRVARVGLKGAPFGPNSLAGPASAPANGGATGRDEKLNFLSINPYPNTGQPGGEECEAGRETESGKRVRIGNPAGNQGTATDRTVPEGP